MIDSDDFDNADGEFRRKKKRQPWRDSEGLLDEDPADVEAEYNDPDEDEED